MKVQGITAVVTATLIVLGVLTPVDAEEQIKCPFSREYDTCGSACAPTCANRHETDRHCSATCIEGCFCPAGMFATEDGQCVSGDDCPDISCNCINGMSYSTCGSPCPRTCANRNNSTVCPHVCTVGCFCPQGMVANGDVCVEEEKCTDNSTCMVGDVSYNDGEKFTSVDGTNICTCVNGEVFCTERSCTGGSCTCANGMLYNTCGSACPLTCDNIDNPPACHPVCVIGCFCPQGMVANGDVCVEMDECTNNSTCIVKGSRYEDGERFLSVDGLNECTCESGEVVCSKRFCNTEYSNVIKRCVVGDFEVFEKQQYSDGCHTCTCSSAVINCTVSGTKCNDPVYRSIKVQMTFALNYDQVITDVDSFKESIKTSLINNYGSTHNLRADQITSIEVSRGSVIAVVTIQDDKEQEQSANVTILSVKIDDDYVAGQLTITYNNTVLEPAVVFIPVTASSDDNKDDNNHKNVIIGVVVAVVVVVLLAAVIIVIVVCVRKNKGRGFLSMKDDYKELKDDGKNSKKILLTRVDQLPEN